MTVVPITSPDLDAAEVSWFSALCSDDYQFLGMPDGDLRSSWDHCSGIVKEAEAQGFRNILCPSSYQVGQDTLSFVAGCAPITEKINMLAAVRCGEMQPIMLARTIATLDHISSARDSKVDLSATVQRDSSAPNTVAVDAAQIHLMAAADSYVDGTAVERIGRVNRSQHDIAGLRRYVDRRSLRDDRRIAGDVVFCGERDSTAAGKNVSSMHDRVGLHQHAAAIGRRRVGHESHFFRVVRQAHKQIRSEDGTHPGDANDIAASAGIDTQPRCWIAERSLFCKVRIDPREPAGNSDAVQHNAVVSR